MMYMGRKCFKCFSLLRIFRVIQICIVRLVVRSPSGSSLLVKLAKFSKLCTRCAVQVQETQETTPTINFRFHKIVNKHKNSFGTGNVAHSLLLNLYYPCINMLIVCISSVSVRRKRTEDNTICY